MFRTVQREARWVVVSPPLCALPMFVPPRRVLFWTVSYQSLSTLQWQTSSFVNQGWAGTTCHMRVRARSLTPEIAANQLVRGSRLILRSRCGNLHPFHHHRGSTFIWEWVLLILVIVATRMPSIRCYCSQRDSFLNCCCMTPLWCGNLL